MVAHTDRAVSPIVGIVLLVLLTITLASVVAGFALQVDLAEPDLEATPDAHFEITPTRGAVVVEHAGGDSLEASRVELDGQPWGSAGTIGPGDSTTVSSLEAIAWVRETGERVVLERVD